MPFDGSTPPLRLTYSPGDHIATDILRDGRILFEASHPEAMRDLFTVYPDGSGVETYRCDHTHDRHNGRELSSGDIIFRTGDGLARFTSARATEVPITLPKGEYAGPIAEIAPDEWLVSYRRALYRLRVGTNSLEKVLASPGGEAIAPVIVRPRTPPKWFPSGLGDRNGANLLCLNVYTSKTHIPDGVVAAVRVWTDRPLGEAPVERDGSFFVNVPSEQPIRFELLDRDHKTVAAEKGYFWARRGEQRVCVGCHAGPERAPENVAPQVLLRTTEPVKMKFPK